jgi:diguanylate cyclase (GGDEF)-like protein
MKRALHHYLLIAVAIYIIAGTASIFLVSRWVTDQHFETMGVSTLNLAAIAANSIKITDEQLHDMESISFQELMTYESNQELNLLFKKTALAENVKYAYVVRKLNENQIKYYVSNLDTQFYDMPVGTPLDCVWLMDVIVNEEEQKLADLDEGYYDDKNRYTHIAGDTEMLYNRQESGYFINNDEWGSQISAMVPIYTEEGHYIGLLGVDVYSTEFYEFRAKAIFILFLLVLIPTVIMSVIYFVFHMRYKREMKNIIFLDRITGLYTRAYYEDYIRRQVKKMRRSDDSLTVVMIDIDDFKAYNDHYGHTKGDEVIKLIGYAIRIESEKFDDACPGRYGGEEFVVFIPNLNEEQGDQLCESIRKRVEDLKLLHETRKDMKQVTVSLGIYTSTKNDLPLDPQLLIEKADKALYMAKGAGKNCTKRY